MQMLPTTNFLGKEITRMIVGDNPQTGHSYIEDIIPGADMKAFYTPEKILDQSILGQKYLLSLFRQSCPKASKLCV